MANPATTHVIEIETGIGEPAFIPLSMGQELQPISVGKKGMWRIESPRVLDVHAFVYFDGTSLFLQSADESNAASVDGYRVGKAWTELHAPCKIEVGTARLRYRSLIADADNQATIGMANAPVQPPPGGAGGGSRPGASMPAAGAPPLPQRMASQQRPQAQQQQPPQAQANAPSPPITFPKAERPFKPGEFAAPQDVDESTRIAPLDATGAGRVASGSHPRPAAGQGSPGDDPSTRPEAARVMRGAGAVPVAQQSSPGGSGQFGAMGMQGAPSMMQQAPGPPGMQGMQGYPQQQGFPQQQGYDPQQQGYDPQQQQGYPQQGYPNAGGSGAFGSVGPAGMPSIPGPPGMPQGSIGPGGYGSMTPQGGMTQPGPPNGMQDFVAKLKANSVPKIIAGVLFIIGGILYLAEDDEPPPPKRKTVATLDGGVEAGTAAGGTAAPTAPPVMTGATTPAWPPGVPCPPPNWPANTPLPCVPNGLGTTGTAPDKPPGKDGGKQPAEPKDAGAPLAAGTKTLERQAVDHVFAGETSKAAAAYEELVRRDPNNKVYAEAARILRAKLDGGLPGGQ
jgi:hypothetical protein